MQLLAQFRDFVATGARDAVCGLVLNMVIYQFAVHARFGFSFTTVLKYHRYLSSHDFRGFCFPVDIGIKKD